MELADCGHLPRNTLPMPADDDESTGSSEDASVHSSGDEGSNESSDDSGSDETSSASEEGTAEIPYAKTDAPIKMRIPSLLDIGPEVTMVRDVEHLKSL
ncbi:hypothetical protein H310_03082 [Aphanomyces invadans]|uniref:Uncharacterized protein n=1 Tax=Aphanomyces invadans TaxID=157072 RepID=A0A024UMB0_9STRA|nr:hypothetical protein H310_03082 [Aphanomyces invadans]ETW06982.1 hypothetical protein H310_03082 [Aphanomyces invadans]|eukprot:XP_008865057.1 hypothetical protein H310_03082 [Aphanomyces invadans]